MARRELTENVDLCLPNGKLNPAAVGFSRRPLHTTNLRGWGRTKRWEYWGIVTPTHTVGMTISNIDYLRVHQLYVYDRATGDEVVKDVLGLLPAAVELPDNPAPLTARMHEGKLMMQFTDDDAGTELTASSDRVQVRLRADWGEDCLCVVVPWSERLFQYTVKDLARPVTGSITVDGVATEVAVGSSYGVLDRGRGRWPYSMTWNWAAGSGERDGVRIGLQLGGKWTDGTGSTENALFVDGRMTYWPDPVQWDYNPSDWNRPWHITGSQVQATLTPFHVRDASTNVGVIASDTHQAFGTWSGWAIDAAGERHSLDGLQGWAEQARNRW